VEVFVNNFKTIILLTLLTVLLVLIGSFVGGPRGMLLFFLIALAFNLGTYWFSDRIVLKMYRAKRAPDDSRLTEAVRRVSRLADAPMPKVYLIDSPHANAFATGRNPENAAVAATTGILNILDDNELEGVVAHEMAHIKNRDILIGTIASVIAGAITMLSRVAWFTGDEDDNPYVGIIIMIVAPIAALLIQMAVSRSREYAADQSGAGYVHNPSGLASALRKLHRASRKVGLNANPATAHMFIVNPLTAKGVANMFSTHPPIEERVARLEAMSRGF
jgi:heat shock protein HtpX